MLVKAPKLRFQFGSKRQRTLKSRGVDGMCFAGKRNAFEFDVAAMRMKPDIPGIVTKGISVKKQAQHLVNIRKHPLRGHPIIGIGSFPSDLRAKMLALNIMDWAIDYQESTKVRKHRNRDYPVWHKVYGGLGDELRDKTYSENPSMLVLSNVTADSTSMKIEKVRDILEKFPNLPRVVVVSGCDPVWFFAMKLHLPMDYGFYIGADNREGKSSVLDL